jgi:hypothetical protein
MSQTPVPITGGTGTSSIAAELVSGTSFQQIEVYGPGGASVLAINPDGSFKASIIGTPAVTISGNPSISGTVGASIIGQLPAGTAPIGSVAVLQGTTPWLISSVYGNISGSVVGFQGGTRTISGSVLTMFAPVASLVSGVSSMITGTGQTSVLATPAGAQRNYITQIIVTNAAAVGTVVNIMDGPNVMYAGYAAASGGGFASSFPTPLKQSNTVTSVDVKAVAQASILVAIVGYTGA